MGCTAFKELELMPNFDKKRYMGTWYEALRSKTITFEKNEGFYDHYTLKSNGEVAILTGYYDEKKDKDVTMTGTAGLDKPNGWAKLAWFLPRLDYTILDTDYDNYAIVVSRNTIFCQKKVWIWILTREKNPKQELVDKAFQIYKRSFPESKIEDFHRTVQGGIIKYPKELD